ncbi:Adiponectin receptor protein [Paramyrothecium foliicola]|nr:Adiponectin receptor protein [Paramyrothecium foliicola]
MDLKTPFAINHALVTHVKDGEVEVPRHKNHEEQRDVVTAATATAKLLLSVDKVPEWYGGNPFILSGYRPVFAAVTPCFGSWFYLHNQTANIYTHLIPGLAALGLNVVFGSWFSQHYPDASLADQAVFYIYLTACALCFGVSATYHTMLCHSREQADFWIRADFSCITLLIVGSFVPQLYMCFYCEPALQKAYLSLFGIVAALNIYSSMNERNGSADWVMTRLVPSVAMAFGAAVPTLHAATIFSYEQLLKQSGLNYYYLEGVLMLIGVVLLATKFPECYFPGKFDYLGSHSLMHMFIVAGVISHFLGILSAFDWNYGQQRCLASIV